MPRPDPPRHQLLHHQSSSLSFSTPCLAEISPNSRTSVPQCPYSAEIGTMYRSWNHFFSRHMYQCLLTGPSHLPSSSVNYLFAATTSSIHTWLRIKTVSSNAFSVRCRTVCLEVDPVSIPATSLFVASVIASQAVPCASWSWKGVQVLKG
jgi:hypothetical protein